MHWQTALLKLPHTLSIYGNFVNAVIIVMIHTQVVIKYVPFVGDSKRAMDEYTSEICMGGYNTIVMHNTCEVSL